MRRPTRLLLLVACQVVLVVVACSEQVTQPVTDDPTTELGGMSSVDSAVILTRLAARAETGGADGPALVGGTLSDTMILTTAVDSIRIELVSRECASPSNTVTVVSPETGVLSTFMCQEGTSGAPGWSCWPPGGGCSPVPVPADTGSVWSFVGPYSDSAEVVLDFETGVSGATGAMQVTGSFPQWTVSFEDGFDSDFNDFELEVTAFAPPFLALSADTTQLHPWIGAIKVNGRQQQLRAGDTASVQLLSSFPGDSVSVVVEFKDHSGGHAHLTTPVPFDSIEHAANGAGLTFGDLVGKPWAGFLAPGDSGSFKTVTDSVGGLSFSFIAGTVSGSVDIIAKMVVDSAEYVDTLVVTIAVPGLVDPEDNESVTSVYFVGGTDEHVQGTNWFVRPWVGPKMEEIADSMTYIGSNRYLQYNDASLEYGGTFTAVPDSSGIEADPVRGHRSHALGVDIDIGFCYTTTTGEDGGTLFRVNGTACTTTDKVNLERLQEIAKGLGGYASLHANPDHYHIRFEEGS